MTDALRVSFGNDGAPVPTAIGCHAFGPEALEVSGGWRFGPNTTERMSTILRGVGGWLLADARGGVEERPQEGPPAARRPRPVLNRGDWFNRRESSLCRHSAVSTWTHPLAPTNQAPSTQPFLYDQHESPAADDRRRGQRS
jgi:hypothetical protein